MIINCKSCSKQENVSLKTFRKRNDLCKKCFLLNNKNIKKANINDICTVNKVTYHFYDSAGVKVLSSAKAKIRCIECDEIYTSTTKNELRKKHKLFCQSCSIKKEWREESYRNTHIQTLKEAHNRPDTLKKHSIASRKNWDKPEIRSKMGGRKIYKTGFYTTRSGIDIFLKSSYEFKIANFLDESNLEWFYEPKAFAIEKLGGSQYIPDFYLKDYNCYIEVKGRFFDKSKIKYSFFVDQYKDINICLMFKEDIDNVVNREVTLENYIKEKNRIF